LRACRAPAPNTALRQLTRGLQATVAADKSLLPIPVNKHIDAVVGLLNDGITSHSGESGIRFGPN
jgi:hypothetical protein